MKTLLISQKNYKIGFSNKTRGANYSRLTGLELRSGGGVPKATDFVHENKNVCHLQAGIKENSRKRL